MKESFVEAVKQVHRVLRRIWDVNGLIEDLALGNSRLYSPHIVTALAHAEKGSGLIGISDVVSFSFS